MTTSKLAPADLAAAFEAEARKWLEEYQVPGVSLALLTPQGDHFVNLGVTSLENPLPVTSDTIFQIGSTTKTITSLTCSVLEAEGKLKLDDPVRKYLPDFKLRDDSVARDITIRDLLTHQGGFQGDLFKDTGDGDDAVARILDILAESPQVVPLRGHWSYNNAGFYVAGRIIEVVTGQTFEAAVTERVFKPLGMGHTLFFPSQIMTHRFAAGHNKVDDRMVIQRPWQMMRSAGPAGGTCSSTTLDMAKYAHYIMSGTLPAAPEAAAGEEKPAAPPLASLDRTRLWAPVRAIGTALNGFPGQPGQIGQSWFVDQYDSATIISHGGTTLGHQSDFWVSPDRKYGFIAMANASNGHAYNKKISEWIKRELLGLTAPEHPAHAVSAGELEALTGNFLLIGMPLKIGSVIKDGVLTLEIPDTTPGATGTKPAPLHFIAPNSAIVKGGGDMDNLGVEFLHGDDGRLDFIRFGARLYPIEREGGLDLSGMPVNDL